MLYKMLFFLPEPLFHHLCCYSDLELFCFAPGVLNFTRLLALASLHLVRASRIPAKLALMVECIF